MRMFASVLAVVAALVFAVSALAVPPGKTVEFEGKTNGKVVFDGKIHADDAWHVRGGMRWSRRLPPRAFAPFVSGELEVGDATSVRVAAGCFRVDRGWEARLEWARDAQWFRSDDSVLSLLLAARY